MKRRDLRVRRGEERIPWSAGEIVEALQGAGVTTDEALRIARDVEKHYRSKDRRDVPLDALVRRLAGEVAERASEDAAERLRAQVPPFVPLRVAFEGGDAPFSRRTLVASLEKLGLGFKDAYALARQAEQGLRTEGRERVEPSDVAHAVALVLEARYGREMRLRYEIEVGASTELLVEERDGGTFPYSRGILARSLMSIGLGPEVAHHLAKRVEDRLWALGDRVVERAAVRSAVLELLKEEAGEEFAHRYRLMRGLERANGRGRPLVVLVGGAPGTGKSTLASELAYRLGIPRIVSTDSVRQALRSLIGPELSPTLHASSYTAWRTELLPSERTAAKPKRKRVLRGFHQQVNQLGEAVRAIIDRNVLESTSLVIEGVHLVPGSMPGGPLEDATVVEMVLRVEDEDDHRRHFGARERQTDARRSGRGYLENLTEIRLLQDFIVMRAREEGVPVLEATDFDQAVERALAHVLSAVMGQRLAEEERGKGAGGKGAAGDGEEGGGPDAGDAGGGGGADDGEGRAGGAEPGGAREGPPDDEPGGGPEGASGGRAGPGGGDGPGDGPGNGLRDPCEDADAGSAGADAERVGTEGR